MVRRDAEPLIWENCSKILERYVKDSYNQGPLPQPPLESPDFPSSPPKSLDALLSQTSGLFSIDKAGFKAKLSEIIYSIEPNYVKRHIDPESEREKWAIKNLEIISKRIIILQIRDWLSTALDDTAPDTDRWYFAIATMIGMCFEASELCREYCFTFIVSIAMAQSPLYRSKSISSGPHHMEWDSSVAEVFEENIPHQSGLVAVNLILDYISSSSNSSHSLLPYWIESLSSYRILTPYLNLFSRIKLNLKTSEKEESEALINATVNLIPDYHEQSKEILISAVEMNNKEIRKTLSTSLSKLYSYDSKLTLYLLDILLFDSDENISTLATSTLGFIIRVDTNEFLRRAPKVIDNGNQKAIQVLIHSSIREYLNFDIMDKSNLMPKLWILSNLTNRSKLVSFIMEIHSANPSSFLRIGKNIFEEDQKSFLEFYNWIGKRNSKIQESLNQIK